MNKIKFVTIFSILCIGFSFYLKASGSFEEERALCLFPHVQDPEKRLEYFFALDAIRSYQAISDDLFIKYPDHSDFYFQAKTKGWFEIDSNNVGRWQEGIPIQVPVWVEAANLKNWQALGQLLFYYPSIVTEGYNDDPFCKIVFEAGPEKFIIERIIEITATLNPDSNPFLGAEKNPKLIPFSSLSLQAPVETVALCMQASQQAAKADPRHRIFYDNAARLCARHLAENTGSPLITMPETGEWEHARAVLLHLIEEEKYQGLDHYFAFLASHNLSFDDFAYVTSFGLNRLAKMGTMDATFQAKTVLLTALKHCPDQETQSLFDFTTFLKDEFQNDTTLNISTIPAQTVFAVIEQQRCELEKQCKALGIIY